MINNNITIGTLNLGVAVTDDKAKEDVRLPGIKTAAKIIRKKNVSIESLDTEEGKETLKDYMKRRVKET